ncbi:MAG: YidC/Oxa1 family membrane protein insertase [Lachnospiraceae bacterium]|nr:YidC/Oxa1 family membrane protein insertase [Lachnospiraceae bacterium]
MVTALYNLIIEPIVLLIQMVFVWGYRVFESPGAAIIAVSLIVNFMILPLYNRADALQEKERKKQDQMAYWVSHIKKAFKGDERFMMLSAYYTENDYKPVYALRSTISLLLQIPFFIAAYSFLSKSRILQESAFLFITDLGEQDKFLRLGTATLNLLPVLMTVINLISAVIYLYGRSSFRRDFIQMSVLALVFLALLYKSPSGLVLYWTMNNVFSLVKNIFQRFLKEGPVKNVLLALLWILLLALPLRFGKFEARREVLFLIVIAFVLGMALCKPLLEKAGFFNKRSEKLSLPETADATRIYVLGACFLTVLLGVLIPSSVISSSPFEFCNLNNFVNPLHYVVNTFFVYAGFFLVWLFLIYYMAKPEAKAWILAGMWCLSVVAVVDYMFFGRNLGILSSDLKFDLPPVYSISERLVNTALVVLLFVVLWLVFCKKNIFVQYGYVILLFGVLVLSGINISSVNRAIRDRNISMEELGSGEDRIIHLSKTGKNVIVFMLDRANSAFLPFIFNEKPEIKEQFAGFTYYPNSLSYGQSTIIAAPALYGGYEYSIDAINQRSDEMLVDKHDEALAVLPLLFDENGYEVTVIDPPFAGYDWFSDISIFDQYPGVKAYAAKGNMFVEETDSKKNDHFWGYSLFKTAPIALQNLIYDDGYYYTAPVKTVELSNFSAAYNILTHLPYMTQIEEGGENTFLIMDNDTAHEPTVLSLPDYTPDENATMPEYTDESYVLNGRVMHMDNEWQITHYHASMAAYIQLGKWFDYLRECGVYDNTRIILVADHGKATGQFDDMILETAGDIMNLNPLLLVKDFNSTEFTVSDEFMVNADVPALATEGIIKEPLNPFTGKLLDSSEKTAHDQLVTSSEVFNPDIEGKVFDTSDGVWFAVHDNIFDNDCWTPYEYSIQP